MLLIIMGLVFIVYLKSSNGESTVKTGNFRKMNYFELDYLSLILESKNSIIFP